jgi:hypothetical protein
MYYIPITQAAFHAMPIIQESLRLAVIENPSISAHDLMKVVLGFDCNAEKLAALKTNPQTEAKSNLLKLVKKELGNETDGN